MAKDDYHVIVYQILCYLYNKLKKGELPKAEMLKPDGDLFRVPELYWQYIVINLLKEGYVSGIDISEKENVMGDRAIDIRGLDHMQITPKGIEYLTDNSFMNKAKRLVQETLQVIPFDLFT